MRLWYQFWQIMSQAVFCAFFRLRVFGRENVPLEGPVVLVSNHQSFLDPVLCGLGLKRELDYIARDSLFRNRLFGRYIQTLNAFPIRRSQADLGAIRTIISRLKQGRAITLFPEATRTSDGRIRPVKSGFELVVRKSGAVVVPVIVDGAFEAWPRNRFFPYPGDIKVIFGKPITAEQAKKMSRTEFVDQLNNILQQMQYDLRLRYNKTPFNPSP